MGSIISMVKTRKYKSIDAYIDGGSQVDGSCGKKYQITFYTGSQDGAGTHLPVPVNLVMEGTNGESILMHANNSFLTGGVDFCEVRTKDIGKPLLVKLEISLCDFLEKKTLLDWYVDRITVKDKSTNVTYTFPCYSWIEDEIIIFEGSAKLPSNHQNDPVEITRKEQLENRQSLYRWGKNIAYSDLPGYVKAAQVSSLPKDVRFTSEDRSDLFTGGITAFLDLGLLDLWNSSDWESFDDIHRVLKGIMGTLPPAADFWKDDRFFGSQFLNGCSPDFLIKCIQLPPHFPVTQELIGNLLDSGHTLENALADERIYMVDYKILEDIPCYGQEEPQEERRYACASMGLFYVKGNGDLVPIAIQLHQNPSTENPIWTPNDVEMDWICAKLWLRNSDAQLHQMVSHLLRTHLSMEPIAVASYRQLPTIHPLWKLLAPHIRGTMAINTFGRSSLISEGGIADQLLSIGSGGHIELMKKHFKKMLWPSYNLPQALKERGVDDEAKLPNFYYRDDGLKLWDAIGEFVKEILGIYYHSEETIMLDHELQSWIRDLHDIGYRVTAGHTDHGVPKSFTSPKQLYDFVTAIIFTCSCQHAAVNFSQKDVYFFIPNAPLLMRQPPPTKKGVVTEQDLMKCLPNKRQSGRTMAVMHELTLNFPDETFIGDYQEEHFVEKAPLAAISAFQQKLKQISAEIKDRNFTIPQKYPYLDPEQVPNSIAI